MRINALRKELAEALAGEPGRKPALRRSLKDEWLYATDLPVIHGGRVPEKTAARLTEAGWEYTAEGGWLQMRKAAEEPPEGWHEGGFGPEAGCCLSLLERHAGKADAAPEALPEGSKSRRNSFLGTRWITCPFFVYICKSQTITNRCKKA